MGNPVRSGRLEGQVVAAPPLTTRVRVVARGLVAYVPSLAVPVRGAMPARRDDDRGAAPAFHRRRSVCGDQPSAPPNTLRAVRPAASSDDSRRAQGTRASAAAPGPWLPLSAYRTVFSREGWSQLCQPGGRTTSDIRVSRKKTLANGRQGRPRYVRTDGVSARYAQRENTKPWRCFFGGGGGGDVPSPRARISHRSKNAGGADEMKSHPGRGEAVREVVDGPGSGRRVCQPRKAQFGRRPGPRRPSRPGPAPRGGRVSK